MILLILKILLLQYVVGVISNRLLFRRYVERMREDDPAFAELGKERVIKIGCWIPFINLYVAVRCLIALIFVGDAVYIRWKKMQKND